MNKKLVLMFLGWKFLLLFFAILAPFIVGINMTSSGKSFDTVVPYLHWIWTNFDGINYLVIAKNGYHYPNFAYFPLLPFLISLVNKLIGIPLTEAGIWITNLSTFFSLWILYKITMIDYPKPVAIRTVIIMLLFPLSFFYQSVYTDSLFLLLSLLSFYYARKSVWIAAGVFGLLAGLSRLVGIVLLPALFLEWFLQQRQKKNMQFLLRTFILQKAFFIMLVPLGLLSYAGYLQLYHGDFLLFQKSMANWQQSTFVLPPQVAYRYIKILQTSDIHFPYFVALFELTATVFYFLLALYVIIRVRLSYGLFMVVLLLIPTFTGTFQSMPRYLLHLFPAFIGISLLTSSKKIFISICFLFLLLQLLLVTLFTRGYFVA